MKQKYKLSKKAEAYLKAQGGLQVPYEYPYQDNTSPFDLGQIDPNLMTAQQNQTLQQPINPNLVPLNPNPKNNTFNTITQGAGAVPFIGTALKLGTGIYSLIQGAKEKKKQQRMELNAQRDLDRRKKESRENDFYYTGQSSGSYSDFNKKGGMVYQNGGFMDFYNQMQTQNKNTQNIWDDYYNDYINEQQLKVQNLQQQGLTNTINGGVGLAAQLIGMQDGGLLQNNLMQRSTTNTNIGNLNPNFTDFFPIDNTTDINQQHAVFRWKMKTENPEIFNIMMGRDPEFVSKKRKMSYRDRFREKQDGGEIGEIVNEDLYSADFQSPVQQNQDAQSYFTEVMNKYQALDPQGSLENKAMSWIFEEEPEPKRYDVGDVFGSGSNYNSSSVIDQIKANESGGNYSAVNPTTGTLGAYQFNPKYWGTQIRDFMGMSNVPINQVIEEFKNNPQAQDKFMEHVVNNVYRPEIERLRPLAQRYGFSDDDLVKLLHYRGIGDTRKRLETGNFEVSQEEKRKYKNPDILKYLGK